MPAVNSALQRARATLHDHLPERRSEWSAGEPNDEERALLARFIEAHERGDAALAVSIAAEDLRITMPPNPFLFEGIDVIGPLLDNALREGEWRLVPTLANRMPTAASYRLAPGDTVWRAFKFDVIRVRRRQDRRDHDVRHRAVPGLRAADGALAGGATGPRLMTVGGISGFARVGP